MLLYYSCFFLSPPSPTFKFLEHAPQPRDANKIELGFCCSMKEHRCRVTEVLFNKSSVLAFKLTRYSILNLPASSLLINDLSWICKPEYYVDQVCLSAVCTPCVHHLCNFLTPICIANDVHTKAHTQPRRSTFRRPNHPSLDGPYFLEEGDDGHLAMSTRAKEIAALIRNAGDSGMGPGVLQCIVIAIVAIKQPFI